jgi:hypothetical protein
MHLVQHHGHRSLASALTSSNACIVCCNIYSTRMYAVRHLEQCLQNGKCPQSSGSIATRDISFKPFRCSICDSVWQTYVEARAHSQTHLPPNISIDLL